LKEIEGGITAPCGFKAGMFTINKVKAAPVVISQKKLRRGKARAIVANSGNANACTGKKGFENANRMCEVAARELGIDPQEVLVASTGVIGEQLPIEKIEEGIKAAAKNLSSQGSLNAAQAIITTDKKIKQIAVETEIPGQGKKKVKIGAIAKGSGMIAPNLATMLCFITTDACITLDALKEALRIAVDKSFNQISVDGDMSTNDTVIALANGKAGNKTIKTWKRKPTLRIKDENFEIFCKNLECVCTYLAKEIVRDGEGATKIFEVKVEGAPFPKDARRIARKIATSNLVKTALAGASPNWGRIMAALGSAHTKVKPEKVDIIIEDIQVVKNGEAAGAPLSELRKRLLKNEISIVVKLNQGNCNSTFWGCDLTEKYVKINKRYL